MGVDLVWEVQLFQSVHGFLSGNGTRLGGTGARGKVVCTCNDDIRMFTQNEAWYRQDSTWYLLFLDCRYRDTMKWIEMVPIQLTRVFSDLFH